MEAKSSGSLSRTKQESSKIPTTFKLLLTMPKRRFRTLLLWQDPCSARQVRAQPRSQAATVDHLMLQTPDLRLCLLAGVKTWGSSLPPLTCAPPSPRPQSLPAAHHALHVHADALVLTRVRVTPGLWVLWPVVVLQGARVVHWPLLSAALWSRLLGRGCL